jgi:hypothetical protein
MTEHDAVVKPVQANVERARFRGRLLVDGAQPLGARGLFGATHPRTAGGEDQRAGEKQR